MLYVYVEDLLAAADNSITNAGSKRKTELLGGLDLNSPEVQGVATEALDERRHRQRGNFCLGFEFLLSLVFICILSTSVAMVTAGG
jgi:hypothetical protein